MTQGYPMRANGAICSWFFGLDSSQATPLSVTAQSNRGNSKVAKSLPDRTFSLAVEQCKTQRLIPEFAAVGRFPKANGR